MSKYSSYLRYQYSITRSELAYRPDRLNLAALVVGLLWFSLITITITSRYDDFSYHWRAANKLILSGDPYVAQPERNPYLYPPLFPYLAQPFAELTQRQAQWAWFVCNSVFLSALIGVCLWLSGSRLARRYWGLVVLGTLLAPPVRLSLQLGQVSLLLALTIISGFALARAKPAVAGFLFALASLIKLFPALLGVYYLLNRRYRSLCWSALMGFLLLLLPLPMYGITPYTAYVRKLLVNGAYPYAAEFNISITGFAERLFTASLYAVPIIDLPSLARILVAILSLGVLGMCFLAGRNAKDHLGRLLQFDVWICGMLLLTPSNGYYNLVFLLLPLLSMLAYLERTPENDVRSWLIVGTALICIPTAWSDWHQGLYRLTHTGWGLLILTPAFYGLLIYLVLLTVVARRHQAHIQAENNTGRLGPLSNTVA